jgi:dihydrofolate reductase
MSSRRPGRLRSETRTTEDIAMGKLTVTEFVTLDGVAQAPGGPDEDAESGFTHGGWQAPYDDDVAGDVMFHQAKGMDALLLGRKTYDIFAGYWPTAPAEIPFTDLLNRVPKYVASRTLSGPLSWDGSTVLTGELAESVAALKERHDDVHVIGSLDLVQSLQRLGLVDEWQLWVYPLVLGTGKQVFEAGSVPTALQLTESKTHAHGVLQLTYEPAGAPTYGTMG